MHIPTVIRADILGYCMGVRRAVEAVENALADYDGRRVYTLGPLIHNKTALDSLAARGVQVLDAEDMHRVQSGDVVVIRAHGVPPAVRAQLAARGCTVIDATCPRVLLSQRRAADFAAKGYTVVIAGDKNHGEVTGIAGYAADPATGESRCLLVENREDAQRLVAALTERARAAGAPQVKAVQQVKAVLISQTTISRSEYDAIAGVLRAGITDLRVFNTICPATMERQKALRDLCVQVDGVLVVGGKNSANTSRLLMSARELCRRAALIETADEIPPDFRSLDRIGLTAGASTPDAVIDAVEASLRGDNV